MAPQFTLVLVRPAFIASHLAIRSILIHCGVFDDFASEAGISVDALLQQWKQDAPYIPVRVKRYDGEHHFGPTLYVEGPDAPIEIVLPWAEIVGIIVDHSSRRVPLGFVTPSTS
jgi:hypothetical protein